MGDWSGCDDPPLGLQWSSAWVKVLGVFISPSGLEEETWRPRRLSFRGWAIVINTLALSRIWYVASLIPMPDWVLASLNRLIFLFFWGGKVDLVARNVVIQPPDFSGSSLVSVQLKVWALHVQWVDRFVGASQLGRSSLSIIRVFCVALRQVISCPTREVLTLVPCLPFIRRTCLPGWPWMGALFALADSLVVASSSVRPPVSSVSTKSTYSLLLEFHRREPACVRSFGRVFGPLYWPSTSSQLFWFSLDRPVIDISWQIGSPGRDIA